MSSQSFDNTGKPYNVSKVINADSSFNLEAYRAYSPLFLPASFAISYGLNFAAITATLVHTFLYYHKNIVIHARRSLSERPDIHARLMSVYKEVPDWWYLTILGLLARSYCKTRQRTNIFCSVHVHVWYHCYRGVEHAAPYMGFRACPRHPCVRLTCSRCFVCLRIDVQHLHTLSPSA